MNDLDSTNSTVHVVALRVAHVDDTWQRFIDHCNGQPIGETIIAALYSYLRD